MMNMKINIKISIIAIGLLISGVLIAQNNAKSLQECIDTAIENNLTLKSGRISIERAKDLQGTAFNIDKTDISLTQDPLSGGGPDNSIALGQSFDFPTLYIARRGLLKAETNLERSNLEVSRNELVKEVTSIYYQLLHSKENINILQKQDSIYDKFVFLAKAKFNAGETSRLELMNAERLSNENKLEVQKARMSYKNIQLVLQRWLNTEESIDPVERSLPVIESEFSVADFNAEQTPLGMVYGNKLLISEKNLSVTKQGYLPGFNFALKNQLLIKGFNPYDQERERFTKGNFMGFEVGISIPLFFGEQRAKTRAARREVEMAKVQQEDILLTIRKEYQTYLNQYFQAKDNLTYYTFGGNRQAEEIVRISQISYEKGEIDYIEYIQNLETASGVFLQYTNAVNDYNQTVITLNYLQGNK